MKLFIIQGDSVEPTAEALTIPEFKKLWQNDSSSSKNKARAALSYIYHSSDPQSAYVNMPDRENAVKDEFLGAKAVTKVIKAAKAKYKELITTPEQRLLEGAMILADKLSEYFANTINFEETDDKGNLVHDPHKAMTSLQKVGKTMESLKELRKQVERGQEEKEQNRGGAELNMFDKEYD